MDKWIWGAVAVLAGVGVYLFATQSTTSTTAPTDLCLKQLPEPFKTQANDIISKGDVALMQSFSTQCDVKGWHCAAKELRDAATAAGAASSKMDVSEVGKKAAEPLRGQTLTVLALFAKPKIGGGGPIDYKKIKFTRPITAADVGSIDSLATSLDRAGYKFAHQQMLDASGAARAHLGSCEGTLEKLPNSSFRFTDSSIKGSVRSIRDWALGLFSAGDPAAKTFGADVLEDEAAKMLAAPFSDRGGIDPNVLVDAAKCLRPPLFPVG